MKDKGQTPRVKDWRGWTSGEIVIMRQNAHLGAQAVATILGRSLTAVKRKAQKERISLRKAGERRGLLLGQPRGQSWAHETVSGIDPGRLRTIREGAISRELDLGNLEARVRDAILKRNRPLCPWCATRPIERVTTGLCEPCHWRELARAHRDSIERDAARRDLDAARQEASRARRRGGAPTPDEETDE